MNATKQNSFISDPCQPGKSLTPKYDYTTTDDLNSTMPPGVNGSEFFYRTMLAVILVLILGILAIYITKKLLPKITDLPGKEIRIIETVHLGPRKSVHLIKIDNHKLLIGSTNENISKLADITDSSLDISTQKI